MNGSQKSKRGGARPGAGRPKGSSSPASLVGKKVYLSRAQWEYLEKWAPDANPSAQVAEVVDRARSFWPRGPRTNPRQTPEQLAKWEGVS